MTLPKLVLPTFLGIGAPRSGSSWLHDLLAAHKAIVMPKDRKELDFFTANFDRGPAWYASYFDPSGREMITSAGEISPTYLYHPEIIPRIRLSSALDRYLGFLSSCETRSIAHIRITHTGDASWHTVVTSTHSWMTSPTISEGRTFKHLEPFINEFGTESFLVIIFEESIREPESTQSNLGGLPRCLPGRISKGSWSPSGQSGATRQAKFIGPMHRSRHPFPS